MAGGCRGRRSKGARGREGSREEGSVSVFFLMCSELPAQSLAGPPGRQAPGWRPLRQLTHCSQPLQ